MALQSRTGRGGKAANVRRTRRGKARRRRKPPVLLLLALGLLIAGFVVRRALVPRMTHYLAYRPPERPPGALQPDASAQHSGSSAPGENLTPQERHELERVIKEKSK